ncbi:MAG: RrF2 family transcriptional regulator [Armatimonadota bacterium]
MKFSTRSTYGLRAMVALALEYGHGPILLKDIAERRNLPMTYLEQLMVPLRKSGLVSATRGVGGGYLLSRNPEDIALSEVIMALEGPLDLVECVSVSHCCGDLGKCALKEVIDHASEMLVGYFRGITLADLASRQRVLENELVSALSG